MLNTIRVNQVGYLPGLSKKAVLEHQSETPIPWELRSVDGSILLKGETVYRGYVPDANEVIHEINFSGYQSEQKGCYLVAGEATSPEFAISKGIYGRLKYDALKFFYHNRGGIQILEEYVGAKDLSRPAGHLGTIATPVFGYEEIGDYKIREEKGWYDAGDHGKYIVNGGITLWTLMNQFERASLLGDVSAFGDGTMNIPESGNGLPDLLDEIQYELDFFLTMQIPQGRPKAGMVFHKIQDVEWTGLGMYPSDDDKPRIIMPPSTAATLNFAAVMAQAARIWSEYEEAYASICLDAAVKAWNAALQYPDLLAPSPLDLRPDPTAGAGPYDDSHVEDEFYWAACELFITTGEEEYYDFMKQSPYFLKLLSVLENGDEGPFTWGSVSGLGNLSLALAPSDLPEEELIQLMEEVVYKADEWVKVIDSTPFTVPIIRYLWGSNSFILNKLMVLTYAYEFTQDNKYLNGISNAMDYLLGKNPLELSYITGYGTNSVKNPHHRFWAHQVDPKWPLAPAGILVGGPFSQFNDPDANRLIPPGSPAQKCYVDHCMSWTTNEITINWNAPLANVVAFLDEKAF